MNASSAVQEKKQKPLSKTDVYDTEKLHKESVRAISNLFEDKLEDGRKNYRIPSVGEIVLVNECERSYSRIHGGRYEINIHRRYFGRVAQRHPHIIVMETRNGMTSERVSDIKVGLVQYVGLRRLPEHPEALTYDERLLSNFIRDFEYLLLE